MATQRFGTGVTAVSLALAAVLIGASAPAFGSASRLPAKRINVDATPVSAAQNETTIDNDPLQPSFFVGGVNDYRSSPSGDVNCGYTASHDNGTTWTSGVLTGITKNNPGAPFDYGAAGDPSVFWADDGTVYFACLAFDRSFGRSAIVVTKSTDGGTTWAKPVAVARSDSGDLVHDKEMITVDNSPDSPFHGRIYVAWTEFAGDPDSSPSQEVLSYSSNGGKKWSKPVVLSGAPSGVEGSHPAVGPDGTVYVSWCSGAEICVNGSAPSQIMVTKSIDGGKTWSQPVAAASLMSLPATLPGNAFRINSLPTTAVNPVNGDVYVSYAGEAKDANVYVARSTDGGVTWSKPRALKPGREDQFFQWMRISPTGVVWICAYDQHWNTGTLLDISCWKSQDGVTFGKAIRYTTASSDPAHDGFGGRFIGDYTGLALDGQGHPRPLWTDTRTGNADAWTGR
jgi:hypothetical protein